jgi:1,4-dihydroxy-2-naphthoyl-CoA hydrolase
MRDDVSASPGMDPDGDPRPVPPGYPEGYVPVVPFDLAFDAQLGLEVTDDGRRDGVVRAQLAIHDGLRGPSRALHGGVISAVAEALASLGTWQAVHDAGNLVMGTSNDTSHLEPLRHGHLRATAVARHRSDGHWLWEVQTHDDDGRLCAITTVNIAVRPARPR